MHGFLAALVFSVCGHLPHLEPGCRCEYIRLHNGWCQEDSVGYLAGVRVPSFVLMEALDPEGHVVDPASLECASCREALKSGGLCARCGLGIVGNRIFASKLSFYAARGDTSGTGVAREQALLRSAVGELTRCEPCAIALYFGSYCPLCNVSYVDGKRVPGINPPAR